MLAGPQPEDAPLVSFSMVLGTHLNVKDSAPTDKFPEMCDTFAHIELVRKETFVQMFCCTEYFELSPVIKKCLHKMRTDLLRQVVEIQEAVKRLCCIRGTDRIIES